VRVRLKGINTVKKRLADGSTKTYRYHRATGMLLQGAPGSPEFVESYAAASKGRARPPTASSDSFAELVVKYKNSEVFKQLADRTQSEYGRILQAVETEFGTLPSSGLDDPDIVRDFLEYQDAVSKASGAREADNRLSVTSAMLTWAKDRTYVKYNHLRGFKRLHYVDRSEIIWLPEHVLAFMDKAEPELQPALILAAHTALRESDLLKLKWSAYRDRCLTVRISKSRRKRGNGRLVEIPCTKTLCRMLDKMPRHSDYILTTRTKRPFKIRYFSRLWHETMVAANIHEIMLEGLERPVALHFNDLRGTAITLLSEAGCTPQEIATITGHSLKYVNNILEKYLARTKGLARRAIEKYEASPSARFMHQLMASEIA
jgi:integrase